jgi:hypothetical protein
MQSTYIFVVICLMCLQPSPLLHLTKSRLRVLLLKHPECTFPRHISRTLQFDLNARKLSLHCVSASAEMFVWQKSKDLATVHTVGNNKFLLSIGLCILLRVYQSIYIETSVCNKCRCSFYCALLTLHVSVPISGHLQLVCNTKNSKAVTDFLF